MQDCTMVLTSTNPENTPAYEDATSKWKSRLSWPIIPGREAFVISMPLVAIPDFSDVIEKPFDVVGEFLGDAPREVLSDRGPSLTKLQTSQGSTCSQRSMIAKVYKEDDQEPPPCSKLHHRFLQQLEVREQPTRNPLSFYPYEGEILPVKTFQSRSYGNHVGGCVGVAWPTPGTMLLPCGGVEGRDDLESVEMSALDDSTRVSFERPPNQIMLNNADPLMQQQLFMQQHLMLRQMQRQQQQPTYTALTQVGSSIRMGLRRTKKQDREVIVEQGVEWGGDRTIKRSTSRTNNRTLKSPPVKAPTLYEEQTDDIIGSEERGSRKEKSSIEESKVKVDKKKRKKMRMKKRRFSHQNKQKSECKQLQEQLDPPNSFFTIWRSFGKDNDGIGNEDKHNGIVEISSVVAAKARPPARRPSEEQLMRPLPSSRSCSLERPTFGVPHHEQRERSPPHGYYPTRVNSLERYPVSSQILRRYSRVQTCSSNCDVLEQKRNTESRSLYGTLNRDFRRWNSSSIECHRPAIDFNNFILDDPQELSIKAVDRRSMKLSPMDDEKLDVRCRTKLSKRSGSKARRERRATKKYEQRRRNSRCGEVRHREIEGAFHNMIMTAVREKGNRQTSTVELSGDGPGVNARQN